MNEVEMNYIKDKIENMNKFNQIEILRIFNKFKITLNENKYGIHINLADLPKELNDELNNYINYVNEQELTLLNIEKQKETFKSVFFTS
jgi:hypothetical protein